MKNGYRLTALEVKHCQRREPVVIWCGFAHEDLWHGANGATCTTAELPANSRRVVVEWVDIAPSSTVIHPR